MPVGTVDYRARLAGPGTQDVLGFMLRLLSSPGGRQTPDATPADPEAGKALQGALGVPSAPRRELRPDEQAAEVDRKAREAHRKMVGAPEPMYFKAPTTEQLPDQGGTTMAGELGIIESMSKLKFKPGVGRQSENIEDRRGETKGEQRYRDLKSYANWAAWALSGGDITGAQLSTMPPFDQAATEKRLAEYHSDLEARTLAIRKGIIDQARALGWTDAAIKEQEDILDKYAKEHNPLQRIQGFHSLYKKLTEVDRKASAPQSLVGDADGPFPTGYGEYVPVPASKPPPGGLVPHVAAMRGRALAPLDLAQLPDSKRAFLERMLAVGRRSVNVRDIRATGRGAQARGY